MTTTPTTQQFDTIDALRLEVGRRPGGVRNLVPNPNGVGGSWGWETLTPGSDVEATGAPGDEALALTSYTVGGAQPAEVSGYSVAQPATPGRWYAGRATLGAGYAASAGIALRLVFRDAAGAIVGAGLPTYPAQQITDYADPVQAPAGTVGVSLHVRAYENGGPAPLTPGYWINFRGAMVVEALTEADANATIGAGFVEPWEYVNIVSPVTSIEVHRAPLAPGTLTATIYDPTLDPAAADSLIRPGVPVRLLATHPTATWAPLFTGEISVGETEYDPTQLEAEHRARITLTATDALSRLANTACPDGVPEVKDLAYALEGSLVPWSLNRDPNHVPVSPPPVVSRNQSATLLDQVLITRDSNQGHAFIDVRGTLVVLDPTEIPAPNYVAGALTEADFNSPRLSFDTRACINYLTVKALQVPEGTDDSKEIAYGPYTDPASIDRWGAYRSEVTVHGLSAAQAASYAAAVLAANGTPARRCTGLTLPMWTVADIHAKAHFDLISQVSITSPTADLPTTVHRIIGVHHIITPEKWLIHHDYADPRGVPVPVTVAAARGGAVANYGASGLRWYKVGGSNVASGGSGALVLLGDVAWERGDDYTDGDLYQARIPRDGVYLIQGHLAFESGTGFDQFAAIAVNGLQHPHSRDRSNSPTANLCASTTLFLTAGDRVGLWAYQNSGVTRATTQTMTELQITRIA